MINLPDVLYNTEYYIHYSEGASLYCNGEEIPDETNVIFYKTAKLYNIRLDKYEYTIPVLYSTYKK